MRPLTGVCQTNSRSSYWMANTEKDGHKVTARAWNRPLYQVVLPHIWYGQQIVHRINHFLTSRSWVRILVPSSGRTSRRVWRGRGRPSASPRTQCSHDPRGARRKCRESTLPAKIVTQNEYVKHKLEVWGRDSPISHIAVDSFSQVPAFHFAYSRIWRKSVTSHNEILVYRECGGLYGPESLGYLQSCMLGVSGGKVFVGFLIFFYST